MFLRNAWYVGAWSHEVPRASPVDCMLLGTSLVMYRKGGGELVALENACPHRKVPLSYGRVRGDDIECGYHGLTFDGEGRCVRAACVDRIPVNARVRSYPTLERYGLIWVWMGDADRADIASVPAVAHWGDSGWTASPGESMTVDCNYLYITDNLLDPSHVAWVHRSSFGNESCESGPLTTEADDSGVTVWRWMFGAEVAPFYAQFVSFDGRCDRKQEYRVNYPAQALIRAVLTPEGSGGGARSLHPAAMLMDSYNFLTPVTESKTRYFWFQLRNFALDDEQVSRQLADGVRQAFEEDRRILNAVQIGMSNKHSPNIDLAIDRGPSRFRRRLALRIKSEESTQNAFAEPL